MKRKVPLSLWYYRERILRSSWMLNTQLLLKSCYKYDYMFYNNESKYNNNENNEYFFKVLSFTSIMYYCLSHAMKLHHQIISNSAEEKVFGLEEVSLHNGIKRDTIWVTFKGGVYDITKFVANHPGGREKIMLAAGKDISPFWNLYQQHYNSKLPMEILETYRVGKLDPNDIVAQKDEEIDIADPYVKDPQLSPLMEFLQKKPINAQPPDVILTDSWITPVESWFVRNHHPVPFVAEDSYTLTVDIGTKQKDSLMNLNLSDLKSKFPVHSIVASLQCGGNRRAEMNAVSVTNGSPWKLSAISTAKWTGVKLRDVLLFAGYKENKFDGSGGKDENTINHVIFESIDGLEASIPIRKAISIYGDVLLAFMMNDKDLPPQHGYPLRVIVPGHVGVRNVKWIKSIRLSNEEAHGTWQRGMAYKAFSPSTKSLEGINVEEIPSMQEMPVQSAITLPPSGSKVMAAGPCALTVKGYSYSGGGKGIVRVDVSIDGGKTWKVATLGEGSAPKYQPIDRSWAWTLWECDFDVEEEKIGSNLEVVCKAIDASYNVQPDTVQGIWNLRGINNNAWHRIKLFVIPENDENSL